MAGDCETMAARLGNAGGARVKNYSPRRIAGFAVALCLLLALPYLELYYDIRTPVSAVTMLPVWFIHQIGAAAHEVGHTALRWLFGYPAFPALDMEYGGGVTYAAPRLMSMQAGVYAMLAGFILMARRRGAKKTFHALCGLALLHPLLAATRGHEVAILYAGHAAEVTLALGFAWYCLFCGARPQTPYLAAGDFTLRIMGAAAGFYLALKNLLLCLELMVSSPLRFTYSLQKDLKAQGDFDWVARITGLDMADAAGLLFFVALAALLFVVYAGAKNRENMIPSRLALCLGTAAASLLAYGFEQFNLVLPFALKLLLLPVAEAGHYMAIIFHEPGHAAAHWLFGIPAIPLLDPTLGGGMTYSIGRSYAVVAGIYALFAGATGLALYKKRRDIALLVVAAAFAHAALLFCGWEPAISCFMGHGTEAIVAGYLLRRALLGWSDPARKADSFVSLALCIHLAGRVFMLGIALGFSNARRMSYYVQKGFKGEGDLDKLAAYLGVSLQNVALGLACFVLLCLAAGYASTRKSQAA